MPNKPVKKSALVTPAKTKEVAQVAPAVQQNEDNSFDLVSFIVDIVLALVLPKKRSMNTTSLALEPTGNHRVTTLKDIDYVGLAFDIVVPFLLDNVFFRGTKGRLIKLVGTVAAQQAVKSLARSKSVDSLLDTLESWIARKPESNGKPFPSMNEAVEMQRRKKYKTKSKPEDYYDPEREMYQ